MMTFAPHAAPLLDVRGADIHDVRHHANPHAHFVCGALLNQVTMTVHGFGSRLPLNFFFFFFHPFAGLFIIPRAERSDCRIRPQVLCNSTHPGVVQQYTPLSR